MTEAYRFANEYGDLTHLPLFSQTANGVTPATRDFDPTVASPPAATSDVDWALVSTLRAQASEQLSQAVQSDRARLDKEAQQELGRSIVLDLIESAMAEAVDAGHGSWSPAKQQATAQAVFDSLFRLGRLQPLVDDDRIENIVIVGHDNVQLELVDGTLVPGPPVADSDQELIDFLVFLASRSEVNARSFSEAQPSLHMRLDGGSRLAAVAWVTTRPSVVIRRHRLMRVTLDDLVARDMMTPVVASFLRAAVRARCSIVVAGAQGAGKTTLVRALCAEIDELEAIGTFETEYELHLHELGRHKVVIPWEARPGSGERGADGRQSGEFTLDEALVDSFRFNLSRQIVGEVRGKEIWAMIKAMESGTGSISTTHAADAVAAVRKLVTCAMEAGPHVTQGLATSKLAATVDLIVQLSMETKVAPGGAQRTQAGRRGHRAGARREGTRLRDHARVPRRRQRHRSSRRPSRRIPPARPAWLRPGGLPRQPTAGSPAMTAFLPALAGGLVALGLLGLVIGLRPAAVPPRESTRARRRRGPTRRTRLLLLAGAALGLVGWLITGWILALVIAPIAVIGLPILLSAPPAATQIARLEAMEEWTRSLSGVLTVGIGLEQALVATLRSTPAPIADEVQRLVTRLRARWDTEKALRAFADELDDATGDLIAANLILGARRRGAGLASVLEGLAESVGADVRARRQVEADRAKPRATARWVTVISASVLVVLALSGTYVEPYRTPVGQVLLVLLLSAYVATLIWMRRMAAGKPLPRFLATRAVAEVTR